MIYYHIRVYYMILYYVILRMYNNDGIAYSNSENPSPVTANPQTKSEQFPDHPNP